MHTTLRLKLALALFVAGTFASGAAFADKPEKGGDKPGKHGKEWKEDKRDKKDRSDDRQGGRNYSDQRDDRRDVRVDVYFNNQHRSAIHEYYQESYRSGHCPPGLAKKRNGCMPPGQAKKWHKGRPLPGDVVYYELPPQVVVRLGVPPAGHRYVRVATDILLIAVGTGMVVDAIQDLGSM
jgi:Ni/Co efflux regulator RcnB